MTIHANRDNNTEPLRPRAARTVSAGDVEQRLACGRRRSAAPQAQRGSSPIRAWRAADTELSKAPQSADRLSAMADGRPAGRHHAAATPTGPRPNGPDRTARMRAIEQAWKTERARQAELGADAEGKARQHAEARRQAEELEAKRQADERIRLALARAKRFRAEVSAEAGEQQPRRDRAGHPRQRQQRATHARARRRGNGRKVRAGKAGSAHERVVRAADRPDHLRPASPSSRT